MTPPAPILYAFDPGKTTGWAKFQHRLDGWDLTDWGIFLDWHGFMNVSFKRAFCNTHAKVVYERLRTNLPYFDPIGLEVIGVIKYFSEATGHEIIGQTAGEISGLKLWPHLDPIKKTVKPIHAYEAALHGIKYIGREHFKGIGP